MPLWNVVLTLKEPFTCSTNPVVSNEIHTTDFIPATLLRGSIYTALERAGRSADVDRWLGVQNQPAVRYSPAWPTSETRMSVPMPLCFVNDKGDVGFGGQYGVQNVLWFGDGQELPETDEATKHRFQWTRPSQRWLIINPDGKPAASYSTPTESVMHVGLHYRRQAARKGALFSSAEILPGQSFRFLIDDPQGRIDNFPSTLFLGKRRSAGSGEASVNIAVAEAPIFPNATPPENEFLVHFLSDCLIPSRNGGWLTGLNRDDWQKLLEAATTEAAITVEKVTARSAHRKVFGWSSVWGRPREPVTAIAAGSCFRITAKGAAALFNKFAADGLGARTEEGFGWIAVNPAWLVEGKDRKAFGQGVIATNRTTGQPPLPWPGLEAHQQDRGNARRLVGLARELKHKDHARKLAELSSLAARSSNVGDVRTYVAHMSQRLHPRGWDKLGNHIRKAVELTDITELRFVLSSAATLSRTAEEAK